ncbi:MBL fold metallo-hydrolase [Alkalihalobacillus sp. MEB130]|uniref:MBL fold metallo-hydrolase n=1 Tax=Alkalihalobacillus sp. MEB130 TaxID=2976704 RepID=UPI0028E04E54|nr:MBL fold metallo-hydrolase [Alkalihalobacillus sp. MEB130]MDT8859538.1 MBL fold metallo-hydrolase [Alkalihalobacillus sp. MEB130]
MKLTVVGYWHGYPESGEATSGYLLEEEDYKILLDCGSGVLSSLQAYCSITDLDAVVLSHYHHDHQADIGAYQYARLINKGMGTNMKEATIYGHQDDEQAFSKLEYKGVIKAKAYDDHKSLQIGPFLFTFFKTKHPVPCYAMKIESKGKTFVYTADSSYFPELAEFAAEADLLVAECSGYKGDQSAQYGHMTSEDVGKLANISKSKKLVLSHLPHYGNHSQLVNEVQEQYSGDVTLAFTGLLLNM